MKNPQNNEQEVETPYPGEQAPVDYGPLPSGTIVVKPWATGSTRSEVYLIQNASPDGYFIETITQTEEQRAGREDVWSQPLFDFIPIEDFNREVIDSSDYFIITHRETPESQITIDPAFLDWWCNGPQQSLIKPGRMFFDKEGDQYVVTGMYEHWCRLQSVKPIKKGWFGKPEHKRLDLPKVVLMVHMSTDFNDPATDYQYPWDEDDVEEEPRVGGYTFSI